MGERPLRHTPTRAMKGKKGQSPMASGKTASGKSASGKSASGSLRIFAAVTVALVWTSAAWADLSAAKTALGARDFPTAITQARAVAHQHPYDAAMIEARAQMELGQLDPALAAVSRAKAAKPRDSAAHALEGLIYLRMKRPGRAMVALRRALDLAENDQQKNIARALIRQARAAQTWHVQGGIGIVPSTNANKATTAQTITVLIPGTATPVQAQLVGGQAKSGTGLRMFGQASRQMGAWSLSFGGDVTHMRDPALRQQSLQGGLTWTKGATRLGLTHQYRWVGGDGFSATTTLRADHQRTLSPHRALRYSASLADRQRYDDPLKDARVTTFALRYLAAPRPGRVWDLGVEVQNVVSASAFEAARHLVLDAGIRGATGAWGWDARLRAGLGRWDNVAPFEPLARRDRSLGLSLSAQNNNVSFYGLTPTYGIGIQHRSSNLARHDLRSVDLFIGLANAF